MRDGGIAAAPQEWRSISAGRSVPTIRVRGACAWLCDKIFGKKEDNFHFPIRARYAS